MFVSNLNFITFFRVFFEKSRIPVGELRHIWQLCDVTRDGALDLAEFTAAMHLVVLRRNNIPIPTILPTCLQPEFLYKSLGLPQKKVLAVADLLQLESDDNQDPPKPNKEYQRMVSSTYDELPSKPTINKSSTLPKNHYSQHQRIGEGDGSNFNHSMNKQMTNKNVISTSSVNRSSSNSPPSQTVDSVDAQNANREWTKFAESPTSNVSSPGPKPVNVTTSIIDPSGVIHPVPLRVTPVGMMEVADDEAQRTFRKADSLVYESGVITKAAAVEIDQGQNPIKNKASFVHQRDSLPTDLRAIQRPHPKKPASKNIGAIPLPPETNHVTVVSSTGATVVLTGKKDVPPLPPPRFVIKTIFKHVCARFHVEFVSDLIDTRAVAVWIFSALSCQITTPRKNGKVLQSHPSFRRRESLTKALKWHQSMLVRNR